MAELKLVITVLLSPPICNLFLLILLGTKNFSSEIVEDITGKVGLKDENVAFVAGATGKVGSRAVRLTCTSNSTFRCKYCST